MQFNIRGRGLKANLVERAVMLSHTKYCSATKMLGFTAEITHDYRLIEI
jgi:putative redox protein